MALNFPSSPTNGQTYTSGSVTWVYSSSTTAWTVQAPDPGVSANAFTSATVAGANTAVGGGANAFTSATVAGANSFFTATIAGANTTVGTGANNFLLAVIAGANTAVGTAANNFAIATFGAANTRPVGNTLSNAFTSRSTRRILNFIPGSNITINVDDDSAGDRSNVTITSTSGGVAVATLDGANTAIGTAANNFASATIAGANTAVGTGANNFLLAVIAGANTAVGAGANNYQIAIQNGANTAVGGGANAFTSATIAGANTAVGAGANAFTSATVAGANTAVGAGANAFASATIAGANTAVGTAANNFAVATFNAANTRPVGNTLSNSFTSRSTRRILNFIPGSNITINVDDDSAGDRSNVTITSTSGGVGVATLDGANTAIGTAANNFAVATFGAANTVPVANTLANNYVLTRSTRRALNFVPGTNITINVNDDSAGDRSNIVITSTATGSAVNVSNTGPVSPTQGTLWWDTDFGKLFIYYDDGTSTQWVEAGPGYAYTATEIIALSAFDKANAANLLAFTANLTPVGNTLSSSYNLRSTRRSLNFIPGSNITINVDDDSAGDRANITITSTATGGGGATVTLAQDAVNATRYVVFANNLTGNLVTANVDAGFSFNPSSNTLTINGALNAVTKSFVIEHPTKEGMMLRYGSLEGPENGVYARGRTQGPYIYLPEYWEKLVDDRSITVSLTPIGKTSMPSVLSWNNEKIVLHSETPIDCFYYIIGERKDVEKLIVEY